MSGAASQPVAGKQHPADKRQDKIKAAPANKRKNKTPEGRGRHLTLAAQSASPTEWEIWLEKRTEKKNKQQRQKCHEHEGMLVGI